MTTQRTQDHTTISPSRAVICLLWHFGGLAVAAIGAGMLAGFPAVLLVLGSWAVLATTFDLHADLTRHR